MVCPDIFVIKILIFYRNDNKKCQKYFAEKMKYGMIMTKFDIIFGGG